MRHKDIKPIVRKQLKKQFPNWKGLSRKEKKEIANKVLSELVAEYDFVYMLFLRLWYKICL